MRVRWSGFLGLLLLVMALSRCRADENAVLVAIGKKATALVERDGGKSSGTAFCVGASGLFVTNSHVVEGAADGKLTLVLRPGEKDQQVVAARVLRQDKAADLALLLAQHATATPLELGDSDHLIETLPVMAFGFPFGRDLAVSADEYPAVTVSTGHVTALRKSHGDLQEIQLDAALNPGNSGGPVLNPKGQVIGIVMAGIQASGINFAIPVNRLKQLLARVDVALTPASIPISRRSAEADFTLQVVTLDRPRPDWEVQLTLSAGPDDHRVYTGKTEDGRTFHIRAVPIPMRTTKILQLILRDSGGDLVCLVKDRNFTIGGKTVSLGQVRRIDGGETTTLTLADGQTLTGRVSGLEAVETQIAGATATLDLDHTLLGLVAESLPIPDAVGYRIVLRQGGKILSDQSGVLVIESSPTARVTAGLAAPDAKPVPSPAFKPPPPPIRIPSGSFDAHLSIRQIALETNDMVYDPFSRRLYVSVPGHVQERGNSLTVIDPNTGRIGESIFVGSEPGRLAISDDGKYIYVLLEGANAIRRFHIPTRTPELQFNQGTVGIEDMKVPPGHSDWVVIAKYNPGLSPRHAGDSLFVNGKEVPGGPQWGPNVLAFAEDGTQLWGIYNELGGSGFGYRPISESGWGGPSGGFPDSHESADDIKYDLGYFYTSTGHIYDTRNLTLVGTFSGGGGLVWPETRRGRVLFLQGYEKGHRLRACDINRMALIGDMDIPDVKGNWSRFLSWGRDCYAFRTSEKQIFLISPESGKTAAR